MEFLQQMGSDVRELLPRMLWSMAIIGVALVAGPAESSATRLPTAGETCEAPNPWIMQRVRHEDPEPN
jgi:hypothetical protein